MQYYSAFTCVHTLGFVSSCMDPCILTSHLLYYFQNGLIIKTICKGDTDLSPCQSHWKSLGSHAAQWNEAFSYLMGAVEIKGKGVMRLSMIHKGAVVLLPLDAESCSQRVFSIVDHARAYGLLLNMFLKRFTVFTCVLSIFKAFIQARSLASEPRQTSCENSAISRNCWGEYDIDTDYDQTWPTTGVTREVSTDYIANKKDPPG